MMKTVFHQKSFDYTKFHAYKQITTKYFFPTIRLTELVSIANLVVSRSNGAIKITREIKRKKQLMYKWFNDNWNEIEPHLSHIHLFNDQDEELGHQASLKIDS